MRLVILLPFLFLFRSHPRFPQKIGASAMLTIGAQVNFWIAEQFFTARDYACTVWPIHPQKKTFVN